MTIPSLSPVTETVMEITNLAKSYGRKQVLSSVSFEACKGDCIGILGANGCGKSTLLAILSGCLSADSGHISCQGTALRKKQDFSACVGYVPQENPLFSSLTVLDNLKYFYADAPASLKEALSSGVPHLFGLDSCLKVRVCRLSGGMRRRLAIACALANRPPILILDEPGASLDLVCKEDIRQYLLSFCAQGGAVILTSHEQSEIELCSRLFLLENGELQPLDERTDPAALTERMRAL